MTTKQKTLQEILFELYEIANKANIEADMVWEKVSTKEKELTDFSRAVGVQIGINRCLSLVGDLWSKAMEEQENE